ncbi:MAG: hypothetical protein MJ178_04845 [Treponemataceae bacterium]|nr:hypothetical protein [Treponemataceae bacterium]
MMQDVVCSLQNELNNLNKLNAEIAQRLSRNTTAGRLRISYVKSRPQCFVVTKLTGRNGRYLRKTEHALKSQLAQKDYDRKMLALTCQWKQAVKGALMLFPSEYLTDVYVTSPYRRQLVTDKVLTDAEFATDWVNRNQQTLGFKPYEKRYLTDRGDYVRSKSEKIIADLLFARCIPYRYESAVRIPETHRRRAHILYPDFVILDVARRKEVIVEHFGLADHSDYADRMVQKLTDYTAAGYVPGDSLLTIVETNKEPLDVDVVKAMLQRFSRV